jgi:hypothetical protein
MNVGIRTEDAQFLFRENINLIFGTVYVGLLLVLLTSVQYCSKSTVLIPKTFLASKI